MIPLGTVATVVVVEERVVLDGAFHRQQGVTRANTMRRLPLNESAGVDGSCLVREPGPNDGGGIRILLGTYDGSDGTQAGPELGMRAHQIL